MKKMNTKNKQENKRNSHIYKILAWLLVPLLSIITILPSVMAKDPYCPAYKALFDNIAREIENTRCKEVK